MLNALYVYYRTSTWNFLCRRWSSICRTCEAKNTCSFQNGWFFSSQYCLVNTQLFFSSSSRHTFSFLICCNTALEPVKACHWLDCAISVVCSITMEHFKCDPKVVRMALCEVQSLSHVTLIWCEATTWDLCDPHWLSLLIWSVLSQIFERMFKGPV